MVWLEGSLVMVTGRLPPTLLDMSKVGLQHRRAGSAELRFCVPQQPVPGVQPPMSQPTLGPHNNPLPKPEETGANLLLQVKS